MLSLLSKQIQFIGFSIGWGLVLLGLSVVSRVGSLEASEGIQGVRGVLALALVLLVAGVLATFELTQIRFWSKIVAYARTGQSPPGLQVEDQSSEHGSS